MSPRTRSLSIAGALALALALPFLVAQTGPQGGLPSRPRFQAVTVGAGTAATTGTIRTTGNVTIGQNTATANLFVEASSGTGASVNVEGGSAILQLEESDQGADNKVWRIDANGNQFIGRTRDDANAGGNSFITVDRTGIVVDEIDLAATVIDLNGAADFSVAPTIAGVPLAGLFALKTADTSRASTTTATDDPTLTFSLASGVTYQLEGVLVVDSTSATPDFKFQWTRPTLQTYSMYRYTTVEQSVGVVAASANQGALSTIPVVPLTVNNDHGIHLEGTLTTTAAGTFALAWAQNTSDAAATVLRAGSWLRLTPVN